MRATATWVAPAGGAFAVYCGRMVAYYYTAGQKVSLEPDEEHVAVDQTAAQQAGLNAKVAAVPKSAVRSGAGVLVTTRASLTADTLRELQDAGALQPVYKRGKVVVVAMPEVRVEFDTQDQRSRVKKLLSPSAAHFSITEDSTDRLVIRPNSGNGADALNLANRIQEHSDPAAVSARFVQFVPKPPQEPL